MPHYSKNGKNYSRQAERERFWGFNGVAALASLSVAKLGENLFWDEEVLMGSRVF
jgi:hypothetical protein